MENIRRWVARGQAMYLDGRVSVHGFPEFYVKAIGYKAPLAMLVAWGLAGLRGGPGRQRWFGVVGLAGLVIGTASLSGYTLGLRFVLVDDWFLPEARSRAGVRRAVADLAARPPRLVVLYAQDPRRLGDERLADRCLPGRALRGPNTSWNSRSSRWSPEGEVIGELRILRPRAPERSRPPW